MPMSAVAGTIRLGVTRELLGSVERVLRLLGNFTILGWHGVDGHGDRETEKPDDERVTSR